MLISALLTLQSTQSTTLPVNLGRATHAWFLNEVRGCDPAMAEALHAPNQERPFTVSNVWGGGREGVEEGERVREVEAGGRVFLRVSCFEAGLAALLRDVLLPGLPEVILLDGKPLRVAEVTTEAEAHPWAGVSSFQGLVQTHTLEEQQRPSVRLRFGSPTVFKSKDKWMPLPLPRLVFEGLVRRWNAFSPVALPAEVARFADETMMISRYRLRTERVVFGADGSRGAFPGFLGQVTFGFTVKDRYWMGLVHSLAAFALYAGVGQRTTMGLGQVRKV